MVQFISDFDASTLTNRNMLRRFLEASWEETYPSQVGNEAARAMIESLGDESLGGILPSNGEKVIVALDGDTIVGSCVYATRQGITYVWGCYVSRSAQRGGTGRHMIDAIVKAVNRSTRLQVTVLEISADAVQFYKRLGFSVLVHSSFELVTGHVEKALVMEIQAADYINPSPEDSFEKAIDP